MHHKRKRPRAARAGCKMCKPWKLNRHAAAKCKTRWQEIDRIERREQLRELKGG